MYNVSRAGNRRIRNTKCESHLGKCESLRPTDSQYFWVTANRSRPIELLLLMDSQKDSFREVSCNKE